jgi:hypothetical protein
MERQQRQIESLRQQPGDVTRVLNENTRKISILNQKLEKSSESGTVSFLQQGPKCRVKLTKTHWFIPKPKGYHRYRASYGWR